MMQDGLWLPPRNAGWVSLEMSNDSYSRLLKTGQFYLLLTALIDLLEKAYKRRYCPGGVCIDIQKIVRRQT